MVRTGVIADSANHNVISSGSEESMKPKTSIHHWLLPKKFARCLLQLAAQVQLQSLQRARLDLRLP